MQPDKKNDTPKIRQLRLENEILRLEIREKLEKHLPDSHGLPLEEENLYLKSLKSTEEYHEPADLILLYEYVGRPAYQNANELEYAQIPEQLDRLRSILAEHKILIEPSFKVSQREMYRFITEDIFRLKIPSEELKGFYSHFNYEDFYPDDNEEIKDVIEEFLDRLFIGELKIDDIFLAETITVGGDMQFDRESFTKKLIAKKEQVSDFELKKFKLIHLDIDKNTSNVCYNLKYVVFFEKRNGEMVKKSISGDCTFQLEKNDMNYWSINQVSIPGLKF